MPCIAVPSGPPSACLKTFEEKFCETQGCASEQFSKKVFWRCLHPHAAPIAVLLLAVRSDYFSVDFELISAVRRAEKMNEVWEDVREYFLSPRYKGWLRKRANIRISARRLIALAREHLPSSGSPPPIYGEDPAAGD